MNIVIAAVVLLGAWAALAFLIGVPIRRSGTYLWWRLFYKRVFGPLSPDLLKVAFTPQLASGLLVLAYLIAVAGLGWWLGSVRHPVPRPPAREVGPIMQSLGALATIVLPSLIVAFGVYCRSRPQVPLASVLQERRRAQVGDLTRQLDRTTDEKAHVLFRFWRGMHLSWLPPPDVPPNSRGQYPTFPPRDASLKLWAAYSDQLSAGIADLSFAASRGDVCGHLAKEASARLKTISKRISRVRNHITSTRRDREASRCTRAVKCDKCGTVLSVLSGLSGKKVRCRSCGNVFVVAVSEPAEMPASQEENRDE